MATEYRTIGRTATIEWGGKDLVSGFDNEEVVISMTPEARERLKHYYKAHAMKPKVRRRRNRNR